MSRLTMRSCAGVAVIALAASSVACRSVESGADAPIVQPGAPGQPARVLSSRAAIDLSGVSHTAADVRFMQGMIHHHAQALEMTALVPSRTTRDDLRLLAARIDASQADEIKSMRAWLEARSEPPGGHDAHGAAPPLMPGMLNAEEMSMLSAATGPRFDRLFLELMIKHHEGALTMVRDLFATPAAGQESDIFVFASDVVADQQMEIARMKRLLDAK